MNFRTWISGTYFLSASLVLVAHEQGRWKSTVQGKTEVLSGVF